MQLSVLRGAHTGAEAPDIPAEPGILDVSDWEQKVWESLPGSST